MKRLGKLTICGLPWNIYEGSSVERDTLASAYGYCDHTRQEIWVHRNLSPRMFDDTLRHEIGHALAQHSGAEDFLKGVLRNSEDVDAVIETLLRILAPHLSAIASKKLPQK